MDIAELIARVEAATGPDRELDGEIAITLAQAPLGSVEMVGCGQRGRFATGAYTHWDAPRYSASINATVALIEKELPDWVWNIGSTGPDGLCLATIAHRVDHNRRTRALHHTPPLALLRAFLRAIQNKEATDA